LYLGAGAESPTDIKKATSMAAKSKDLMLVQIKIENVNITTGKN